MAVTAWVQGEHSVLRLGFPLWGSRTFPLNSLLSPNLPELQMFVSAQTSSKGPAGRGLGAQLSVYIPSWDFADHNQRLRSLSDGPVPDIGCLFCNIPQTALPTAPESGISAEKSSRLQTWETGFLIIFLFIPVNHKKGWIPCDSCCVPPLCRCRPTLLHSLGGCWNCCGNTVLKED